MKAHEVFKEVLSQDVSPVVISGRPEQTFEVIKAHLAKAYSVDQYLVYDGLMADSAREFGRYLQLKSSPLEVILVKAAGVTAVAWQKCLKVLEESQSNTKVIFVSTGQDVPKAVVTRSFRCYIPAASGDGSYSAQDAHSVGSWVVKTDLRDREGLLKACQGWDTADTDLLIRELSGILLNESILGLSVIHLDTARIMYAIDNLSKYRDSPTVALSTGLRMIS